MRIAEILIKKFEPHIQAMITERILLFHDGMVEDKQIKPNPKKTILYCKEDHSQQEDRPQ